MRLKGAWEVRLVHTAQLCPLHLTPDWPDRRSSWWRSCSPLAFVCCIGNYLKSCGALCGKRIRFNARRNAPRVSSGTSSIKVKCTCIGRHAPLFCVPPLCQHHLLRESFFNTSCIADIMKWPPDRLTDGSLPQSPWNRTAHLSVHASVHPPALCCHHFDCI